MEGGEGGVRVVGEEGGVGESGGEGREGGSVQMDGDRGKEEWQQRRKGQGKWRVDKEGCVKK